MKKEYGKFYFTTMGILLLISAYPVIMGFKMMYLYIINGIIEPKQYIKGVIPYVAICLSLLIITALHPVFTKLFKKLQLLVTTALSIGLFVWIELIFESIKINTKQVFPITGTQSADTIDIWQSSLCRISPQAIQAERVRQEVIVQETNSFDYVSANGAYKIHYFLLSIIIVMVVTSIIYGFGKMAQTKDYSYKKSLILQLVSVIILLALCIFATITGFFRETSNYLSLIPSILTSTFFIILGACFGVYVGSFLMRKVKLVSKIIPAISAIFVCSAMYVGEYILLGGTFYRFGQSWFFQGVTRIVLSPADILIILITGIITYGIFAIFNRSDAN